MKVKQLIQILEDLDPDFDVLTFNYDSFEVESVTDYTVDETCKIVYLENENDE